MFIQIKARLNHSYTKIYNLFVNIVQLARNHIYYVLLNLNSSKTLNQEWCVALPKIFNIMCSSNMLFLSTRQRLGGSWFGSKWSISTSRDLRWPPRGRWSSSSCSETSKYCHQALFCCVFQDLIENTPKSITSSAVTLVPRPNNFFHLNKGTWNRKQLNKGAWNDKTMISMTNSIELGLTWE